ncbi:MAG TPA: hypothetical protein VG755_01565, partial [Nannocystaceae bacterium]|nr:hypothetical protein [Nannocystaceae bacterium]
MRMLFAERRLEDLRGTCERRLRLGVARLGELDDAEVHQDAPDLDVIGPALRFHDREHATIDGLGLVAIAEVLLAHRHVGEHAGDVVVIGPEHRLEDRERAAMVLERALVVTALLVHLTEVGEAGGDLGMVIAEQPQQHLVRLAVEAFGLVGLAAIGVDATDAGEPHRDVGVIARVQALPDVERSGVVDQRVVEARLLESQATATVLRIRLGRAAGRGLPREAHGDARPRISLAEASIERAELAGEQTGRTRADALGPVLDRELDDLAQRVLGLATATDAIEHEAELRADLGPQRCEADRLRVRSDGLELRE